MNKLLTLQIKLPKPFYFETILLKPNIFSLRVLSCFFFHARPFPRKRALALLGSLAPSASSRRLFALHTTASQLGVIYHKRLIFF